MSVASENSPIVSVKTPSLLAVRDAVGRRKSLIPVPIGNSIRHSTEVTPSHSSVPMIRAKRKSDGITQDDPAVKKSKNVVEMNQPSSPRGAERRRQNVLRQKVTDRQARISAADRLTGGAQQFQFGSPISRFTSRADIECEVSGLSFSFFGLLIALP